MSKAYANRKPVSERPEQDFYSTPYSLTWELLKLNEFPKGSIIYEPADGSGAISSQLVKAGHKVITDDIRTTGKDFLKCEDHYDFIITNPPFSCVDDFVMQAKKCCNKFAFIMKTNFLGSQSRVKKAIWKNCSKMYVLSRQVDYRSPLLETGEVCVGNLITSWCIWDKTWDKDFFETRVIDIQKYCTLGSYDNYIRNEYYKAHTKCPVCNTLVKIGKKQKDIPDMSLVTCNNCGYIGSVENLI